MKDIITYKQAASLITSGSTIMVGGFLGCGSPHKIIEALSELDIKDLTLICNDGGLKTSPMGTEFYGVAKLIHNKQIKKLIVSHVGLNPEVAQQVSENTLELVLVPQGSLAEMIRAGGAGLGGVLTPTGVGTVVEESEHVHSIVELNGRKYLLEKPLRADFAIICGYNVDESGNVWYKGSTRNFNPIMATAADKVIIEADNVVETGSILSENIVTPGILVDYIAKEAY